MTISVKQNEPQQLRLLAAQRYLYSQAKRFHLWRLGTAILLAALAPVLVFAWPDSRVIMAFLGAVGALLGKLVLQREEVRRTRQAANIQEQFDVAVFGLPWNRIRVGPKLTPELISAADRDFKGDRSQLKDWYVTSDQLSEDQAVLLCQRSNLVWDWRMRRQFAALIAVILIALGVLDLAIALITDMSLLDFLLALLFPTLPAFLQGTELVRGHWEIAEDKEGLEKVVCNMWEESLAEPSSVTLSDCRCIQDRIYELRCKSPLVPDQWYGLLRKWYQIDMAAAVSSMVAQALDAKAAKNTEAQK